MLKQPRIILLLLLVTTQISFSQIITKIEIGDDAKKISQLVEWSSKDRNTPDSFGNVASSRWTYDVKYANGQITEVIQCRSNQLVLEFKIVTDYCIYYIMKQEKLAYVLYQYEKISVDELRRFYEDLYSERKIDKYYFSEDYKHYTEIYLHGNGYATAEYRKTNIEEFPNETRVVIAARQKREDQEQSQKMTELEKEKQRIKAIKSKIYDVEIYDTIFYYKHEQAVKESILEYLRNEYSAKPDDILHFNYGPNVYDLTYTLKEVESSYPNKFDCVSVSGTDKECSLFNKALMGIRSTKVNGIEVRTTASFKNFKVLYYCGEGKVKKNKNGEIKFLGNFPENRIVIEGISQGLEKHGEGKYLIVYEIGELGDEKFNLIDVSDWKSFQY